MRYARWGTRLAAAVLVVALVGAAAVPARGEIYGLGKGDPAPADGILFDETAVRRVVEELRDGRTAAAKAETLEAENRALREQIASLQREIAERAEEARKREIALAIAEDRQKRMEEYERRVAATLERADRAIGQYEKLVDRLSQRVESLERRMFWTQILGVLGPIGVAAGVLFAR